ncbi:MAG: hypothetical protein JNM98_21385 [Rhodocyclaceae bacterium]|nr:hypothetical protein [Rhodocyclaceae bacterium]
MKDNSKAPGAVTQPPTPGEAMRRSTAHGLIANGKVWIDMVPLHTALAGDSDLRKFRQARQATHRFSKSPDFDQRQRMQMTAKQTGGLGAGATTIEPSFRRRSRAKLMPVSPPFDVTEAIGAQTIAPFDGYYGKALNAVLSEPVSDLTFVRTMHLANVPESDHGAIKQYDTAPDALAAARNLPINLLIIGENHGYKGVKYDFHTYFPLLPPGAYVIFDDYNAKEWPGVQKFIGHDVEKTPGFEYPGSIPGTAAGRKRKSG